MCFNLTGSLLQRAVVQLTIAESRNGYAFPFVAGTASLPNPTPTTAAKFSSPTVEALAPSATPKLIGKLQDMGLVAKGIHWLSDYYIEVSLSSDQHWRHIWVWKSRGPTHCAVPNRKTPMMLTQNGTFFTVSESSPSLTQDTSRWQGDNKDWSQP